MNLADITGCLSKTLKIEENNKQIPVLGGSGCVRGGVHPNGWGREIISTHTTLDNFKVTKKIS